ncbi:MAG: DNA polymerase I [Thermodesulfovibrionales bacterium]
MNLFLIDGNSYVYRAYYAIRSLSNSQGFPTNAIYGFTNMLLKIMREKRPDRIAIAFDSAAPTERHLLFRDYKANRTETPSDLVQQLPAIRKVVNAFRIKTFELPGYEADDIIGTIAAAAAAAGLDVRIVTSDKDMLQLVSDRILIYDPVKDQLLDSAHVRKRFGVPPARVAEFLALTGDASDNIPGIRGVGEKTARELLAACASLEELFDRPELIAREKLRALVAPHRDAAMLSRRLATIDTSVPVDLDLDALSAQEPDWLGLLGIFREFEFTRLMKLIPSARTEQRRHCAVSSAAMLRDILAEARRNGLAFDIEATGTNTLRDSVVGVALCTGPDAAAYLPLAHSPESLGQMQAVTKTEAVELLRPAFEDPGIPKTGHNLKYDISMLQQEGIRVGGELCDTMLAAYLLNPNKPNHSLDEVSFEYLSKRKRSFAEVLGKRASFAEVPLDEAAAYAAEDAALSFELRDVLLPALQRQGLTQVYETIEMPLVPVLVAMERNGVKIDAGRLSGLSASMTEEVASIQKRIYFLAGEEFNINSPKQLGVVLFDRLGLSPTRKTKTGFSTGMDVLEDLAAEHELPREVLLYRSLSKLKSTYLDVLPGLVNPRTGRIHTSFNQTATATGRLSSSDPNLQNIPVRSEWGKRIREAFIAEPGCCIVSADYSQVELRLLAHLSGDQGLISAFSAGIDIHSRTAAEIYGIAIEQVTPDMRRVAKTVNFGIIYGISAFGLAGTLSIDRKKAEEYIRQYFDRHPGVREYMEKTISEAARTGYTSTLFGRRRPIPELQSSNRAVRSQGERLAVNSPIQGTAADIIKLAMIRIHARLAQELPACRMILQVHDELLFEAPEHSLDLLLPLIRDEMQNAAQLSVPLQVDVGYGPNWSAAH